MRTFLIVIDIIAIITGIIFVILPMGTIAFLPVVFAIILAIIVYLTSRKKNKTVFPRILLALSVTIFFVVIAKDVLVKDKVVIEQGFIQEKMDSKSQAQKELENLEGMQNNK